jgi:probable HAF family extracellular repeat protein
MRASIIGVGLTASVIAALTVSASANAQQYSLIRLVASEDFANNLQPGTRIINSAGQVIGNNNNGVGYLYSKGALTAIPPLATHHPNAFSINDSGQVTGLAYSAGGPLHAYLYSSSSETIIDLGTLNGSSGVSIGYVINRGGQVAGISAPGGGDFNNEVFLYSSGSLINLNLPTPNGHPTGISNTDDIVGTSGNSAYLYSNGTTTDLGPGLPPVISANGHVGGTGSTSDGGVLGFVYRNGREVSIGTLNGGTVTFLNAINNKGQATGYGDTATSSEIAFLYSNGTLTNLGVCCGFTQSVGNAINNRGEITGQLVAPNGRGHGFLYSNGVMIDLNTLVAGSKLAKSFVIDDGVAINDDGWIVAEGYNSRTFLTYELLLKPEGKRASP